MGHGPDVLIKVTKIESAADLMALGFAMPGFTDEVPLRVPVYHRGSLRKAKRPGKNRIAGSRTVGLLSDRRLGLADALEFRATVKTRTEYLTLF
jgi:hypothetical protein